MDSKFIVQKKGTNIAKRLFDSKILT